MVQFCRGIIMCLSQYNDIVVLKFKKLGFPTKRWEDWRFTNLKNIRKRSFSLPTYPDISAIDLNFYFGVAKNHNEL